MRQIKFRAWDTQFKRMLNNVAVCDGIVPHIGHHCEVMQFTGLKDKNDKEIYEGDIVKAKYHWDEPHVIALPTDYYDFTEYTLDGEDMEVIGNFYENPELLNKGNTYD